MTSITVDLPDELAARVEALAAKRGITGEQVLAEVLEAHLPRATARPRLSFIGIGASGGQSDAAIRHREIIREASASRTAATCGRRRHRRAVGRR